MRNRSDSRTLLASALLASLLMLGACADGDLDDEAGVDPGEEDSNCVWGESEWDDCDWS
ncbi:hypothetical protein J2T60_002149 [Natronospira proteinivora]|uniref:Uncharacterized protein n=1 Tax=Natronospira proteinivora TaxID=1807133 RepID=A0ABT1G9Z3_9GAMM|nr:hypothetical protein [Natronospira proteinivora]MCP1728149.1 hypothetical protein [Natronospira proteinivora]